MSRVLVDTNVLVSFLTDRDPAQQTRAAALFGEAAGGQLEILVPHLVLAEAVFVLTKLYQVPPETVATILGDLLRAPGVTLVEALPWVLLLELWPSRIPAFTDATIAAVARSQRVDSVATFDRGLGRALRKLEVRAHWTH